MRMLAIYNGTNKRFRHDGDEFAREARNWYDANMSEPVVGLFGANPNFIVDVRDGRIRRQIKGMTRGLDVLAIFDHGTPKGLPRMRESYKCAAGLAKTIAGVTDKITIILYACSCGRGWWWNKNRKGDKVIDPGLPRKYGSNMARWYSPSVGYAIALCSELFLNNVDATVWAHLTAGHTTRNPHVVRIGLESKLTGLIERKRFVTPGTPEWKQWKADMRGPRRFTFWR